MWTNGYLHFVYSALSGVRGAFGVIQKTREGDDGGDVDFMLSKTKKRFHKNLAVHESGRR